MSDPNAATQHDATKRENGTIGGKAGQHSSFYDQIDNSTTRELSDKDNGRGSGGLPEHRMKQATAGRHQR